MTTTRSTCALLLATAFVASTASAADGDWPRFRGPNLDGISKQSGLLQTWPEDGPKVAWRVPIGEGFSGISVVGSRLYTQYDIEDGEHLVAHDADSGKLLWKHRLGDKYISDQGNGPRSTPAVDGDRVFAVTAQGRLHAVSAESGKSLWMHDLVKEYGGEIPRWGVSTAPVVHGPHLLVNVGGKGKANIAFDKTSGEVVWASGDDGPGYSSPVPVKIGGVDQILFFTARSLVSVNPKDGAELWRLPWETDWDVNAATPILIPPNRLFVSSGYQTGAALLEIDMKGAKPTVTNVWKSTVMKNQFSSSIVVDGHAYGFDNRVFKCIDVTTGEEKWKRSGLGHGSLTFADGHLYVLSERGKLVLVEATPEEYRPKSTVDIFKGKCWTVPTLANGRLYLRDEAEMVCLDVVAPRS